MCPAFLKFWAKSFIVNLPMKANSTVTCVPSMLEHVCYEPFSLKNSRFGRYLMLVEICVLCEIHVSKTRLKQVNENLRLNVYALMFWEPVCRISRIKAVTYCSTQNRPTGDRWLKL